MLEPNIRPGKEEGGERGKGVVEGLAEGNDTASYFLPVHAESACRRYRSRPSSPSISLLLSHQGKRESGVGLGWVNGVPVTVSMLFLRLSAVRMHVLLQRGGFNDGTRL